jgi:hypothetical protein
VTPAEREADQACTKCGGPLYAAGAFAGPSLLQGKAYCEPCAVRLRIRTRAALIGAAVLTLSGVGGGVVLAATHAVTVGAGGWLLPVAALAEYGLVFGGAIRWMKRRNASALRAIESSPDATI